LRAVTPAAWSTIEKPTTRRIRKQKSQKGCGSQFPAHSTPSMRRNISDFLGALLT
jgi:hypothetical protein